MERALQNNIVQCPQCETKYTVNLALLPPTGERSLTCAKCQFRWAISLETIGLDKIEVSSSQEFSKRGPIQVSIPEPAPNLWSRVDVTSAHRMSPLLASLGKSKDKNLDKSSPRKRHSPEVTELFAVENTSLEKGMKRSSPLAKIAIGVGILGLALLLFLKPWRSVSAPSERIDTLPLSVAAFSRPESWYRQEPSFYAHFLEEHPFQSSGFLSDEALRWSALSAEAMVLDGVLNNQPMQVAKGVANAWLLFANDSHHADGLLALVTFAEWTRDYNQLTSLAEKWPSSARDWPEWTLLTMILEAEVKHNTANALAIGKSLLEKMPNYRQAASWLLFVTTDFPVESNQVLGENFVSKLTSDYNVYQSHLHQPLPPFYIELNRKLRSLKPNGK